MTQSAGNTVVDYTIEVLRDAIRTGRFVPGQRLIVADISQEFSVSAGPVREAIRRLTGEGLIEIVPHRGASVRQIGAKDLREIYQLREAIEGAAAHLAAENSANATYREELIAIQDEMDQIVASSAPERFLDNNRRFHDLIYRMAGNERMRQLSLQLILPIYQLRLPNRMVPEDMLVSYEGHRRIVAAILAGQAQEAEHAMRQHVAESGQGLIMALESAEAAKSAPRRRMKANPSPAT